MHPFHWKLGVKENTFLEILQQQKPEVVCLMVKLEIVSHFMVVFVAYLRKRMKYKTELQSRLNPDDSTFMKHNLIFPTNFDFATNKETYLLG